MTFLRAIVIAVMTAIIVKTFPDIEGALTAIAFGGVLWYFTDDPLPRAIERGLEDFARKHRGGRK